MPKGKAIYTIVNGRRTFIGKHVGDSIVREFPFASSVLWQNKSLSFDKRLLDYAKNNDVKTFIFSDLAKRVYLKLSIESVISDGSDGYNGAGLQWYIPMKFAENLEDHTRTSYIKDELVI